MSVIAASANSPVVMAKTPPVPMGASMAPANAGAMICVRVLPPISSEMPLASLCCGTSSLSFNQHKKIRFSWAVGLTTDHEAQCGSNPRGWPVKGQGGQPAIPPGDPLAMERDYAR